MTLAVLYYGRKIVLTTILKLTFALCNSSANRAPVQNHMASLQITVSQRSGALFLPNTLSALLKKFECFVERPRSHVRNVACESVSGASREFSKDPKEEHVVADDCICFLTLKQSGVVTRPIMSLVFWLCKI